MRKVLLTFLCLAFAFSSCEDEFSSQYSAKYPVQFYFVVAHSAELINVVGNLGEYATIRRKSGTGYVRIENVLGGNDYTLSYVGSKDFRYGLGGLIVGTTNIPNMRDGYDILAYDLACPTCERADRRLTISGNGTAYCKECGITYDMNNYGIIVGADTLTQSDARGLFRYRITYDGQAIRVFN